MTVRRTFPLLLLLAAISLSLTRAATAPLPISPEIQRLSTRAEAGDAQAQYELGQAYANGEGVERNDVTAMGWFRKAADQRHAEAWKRVGDLSIRGDGIDYDLDQAVSAYRTAMSLGSSEANIELAELFLHGEGGGTVVDGLRLLRDAAGRNDLSAQNLLGTLLRYGDDGFDPDRGEAIHWLLRAAAQDDPAAMDALAAIYLDPGPTHDEAAARQWKQAAIDRRARAAVAATGRTAVTAAPAPASVPVAASPSISPAAIAAVGDAPAPVKKPALIPEKTGDAWGFIDTAGKVVVAPKYESVFEFKDGFWRVTMENFRGGFVNDQGQEICPLRYSIVAPFSEGLSAVHHGDIATGKWGYLDTTGREVIPPTYDEAYSFQDGLGCVIKDKLAGYIDKAGRVVIPLQYQDAHPFSHGIAPVKKDDRWQLVDRTGRTIALLDAKYSLVYAFSEGFAPAAVGTDEYGHGGKWGYIDEAGHEVVSPRYLAADDFHEGLARVMTKEDPAHWDVIDRTGRAVITSYGILFGFSEGLAMVQINDKWGFIDHAGKLVIPARYDSAADFAQGAALVSTAQDIFFIDPTGRRLDGRTQVLADPALDGTEELVRGRAAANAGDFVSALAAYQQAAAKNNAEAMAALGELYENGQGAPKDRAQAIAWYAKAGEHGDGLSAARAATLRTLPSEKPRTAADEIASLQPLAMAGNADAQLRLALLLGPSDKAAAIDWLRKSATGDNLEAKLRYAFLLVQGRDVPGDAAQGFKLLGEAADGGLALAQFEYGRSLVLGAPALPADPARGIGYLQKAAAQKVPPAAEVLGEIYERGIGTSVNLKEALTWYQLAVNYGYAQARTSVDRVQLTLSGKPSPTPAK